MTAQEKLDQAVRVMKAINKSCERLYESYKKQGSQEAANAERIEGLTWDNAIWLLTDEEYLKDIAAIYLPEEVSEQ